MKVTVYVNYQEFRLKVLKGKGFTAYLQHGMSNCRIAVLVKAKRIVDRNNGEVYVKVKEKKE